MMRDRQSIIVIKGNNWLQNITDKVCNMNNQHQKYLRAQ